MQHFQSFVQQCSDNAIIRSIFIVVCSIVFYKILAFLIIQGGNRFITKPGGRKSKTYVKLTRSILRYAFVVTTIILLLQTNGINASSTLAGVGLLGIILGFAVQDILKDILKGMDIISDGYFHVGDVIRHNGVEGKVLAIGVLTTKIEDVRTKDIISISNRNIEEATMIFGLINLELPLPFGMSVQASEEFMQAVAERISALEKVAYCKYKGTNDIKDSAIFHMLHIKCHPEDVVQVRRDALRCALLTYEKFSVTIPYPQLDIHQK